MASFSHKVLDGELRRLLNCFSEVKLVFKTRKENIAFDLALDEGQVDVRANRQGEFENLRASYDEIITRIGCGIELRERVDCAHTRYGEVGLCEDDAFPVWQWLADGIPGFAAHNDDIAGGEL